MDNCVRYFVRVLMFILYVLLELALAKIVVILLESKLVFVGDNM